MQNALKHCMLLHKTKVYAFIGAGSTLPDGTTLRGGFNLSGNVLSGGDWGGSYDITASAAAASVADSKLMTRLMKMKMIFISEQRATKHIIGCLLSTASIDEE